LPAAICVTDSVGKKTTLNLTSPKSVEIKSNEVVTIEYSTGGGFGSLTGGYDKELYFGDLLWNKDPSAPCTATANYVCAKRCNKKHGCGSSSRSSTKCPGISGLDYTYKARSGEAVSWDDLSETEKQQLQSLRFVNNRGNTCLARFGESELTLVVSSGACETRTPPNELNIITGTVGTAPAPQGSAASETASAAAVAILYSGTAPDEEHLFKVPLDFAIIGNGSYRFSKIPSGDYFVEFKAADGFRFEPSFIGVTALSGGTTTVPPTQSTKINYADSGCIKSSPLGAYSQLSNISKELRAILSEQVTSNERRAGRLKLDSVKFRKFNQFLTRSTLRADDANLKIAQSVLQLPLTVRGGCPASSPCNAKDYRPQVSLMKRKMTQLFKISKSIALSAGRTLGKTARRLNTRFVNKANKQFNRSAKHFEKLPKKSFTCPEI
jgi:hypothetical protein